MNIPWAELDHTPAPSLRLVLGVLAVAAVEAVSAFWLLAPLPVFKQAAPWFGDILLVALALVAALSPFLALALLEHRRRNRLLRATLDLSLRNEQLRLIGRLGDLLGRESGRQRIVRAVVNFFVEEMGAASVVYWQSNSDGEPEVPSLARPRGGPPSVPLRLSQPQRVIFARSAARGSVPLVVSGDADQPRPVDPASRPPGPFVLFLPLPGSEMCEGVMELHADGSSWGRHHWEIISTMAPQVGAVLERGRSYEEMQERAEIDYVTGLYNHRFIQAYLQQLLATATARGCAVAVLLLDIDNFRVFNDSFGHSVGDRVLQTVADQLRLMTDKVGAVGRFGGDEFIVILPGHSRQEAESFVQAFQDWLSNVRAPTASGSFPIRVSCGVSVFPYDADKRQELLAVADARLYKTKHSGGRVIARAHDSGAEGQGSLGVFGLLDRIVASIDSKDHYTRAHCENTAEYALLLAQELGVSPSAQRILRLAALLHDVGKIGIPDDILRKPGSLSPEEFAIIKHHVNIAGHLIVDIPNAEEVRKLALHHHERWDGSGYPDGLKGEQIPYLARILAVADAFSAVTLNRPHRRSLPYREAYQELRRVAGTQLDPDLVKAFGRVVRRLLAGGAPEGVAASVRWAGAL